MTAEEFVFFTQQAFIAFPGLKEWLYEKSPEPSATIRVWGKTLEHTPLREAIAVLDGWTTGAIKDPPTGYKREVFAIDVRSIASESRRRRAAEQSKTEQRKRYSRDNYQPSAAFQSIAEPFSRILELRKRVMAGELELEDCEKQVQQIVDEF